MENSTLRLKTDSKFAPKPSRSPCRATEGVGLLMAWELLAGVLPSRF